MFGECPKCGIWEIGVYGWECKSCFVVANASCVVQSNVAEFIQVLPWCTLRGAGLELTRKKISNLDIWSTFCTFLPFYFSAVFDMDYKVQKGSLFSRSRTISLSNFISFAKRKMFVTVSTYLWIWLYFSETSFVGAYCYYY